VNKKSRVRPENLLVVPEDELLPLRRAILEGKVEGDALQPLIDRYVESKMPNPPYN